MQPRMRHLEDKVAQLGHNEVLQRLLPLESFRQQCLVKEAQQVHDAAEAQRATQQIKEKQDRLLRSLKLHGQNAPKTASPRHCEKIVLFGGT